VGKLVEQPIPSLFGGVSKQPDAVRRPEQIEQADNAMMSVVTGGFEKRPPSTLIKKLTYLSTSADYSFHSLDRSATEQYFVLVDGTVGVGATGASIIVMDSITGTQKTVTVSDSTRYFMIETTGLDSTGIVQVDSANMSEKLAFDSGETAFAWSWLLSDGTTGRFKVEGSVDGTTWVDIATAKGGATSGTFSTTIAAVATGDHNYIRVNITTGMATSGATMTIKATFKDKTYILGANSEDIRMASVADTTFIVNRNKKPRMAEADTGSINATYQTFTDLPAGSGSGNIAHIIGDDVDGFGSYYVVDSGTDFWEETVDPTAHNAFDFTSLPHTLTKQTDGTFVYTSATWDPRGAGDEEITPVPPFVGLQIQDLTLYRNRLTFIADEETYSGQAGDIFNMWPQKAVEVLDNDPVSRGATTSDVNILKHATVFRKILFTTSRRAQFELTSSGAFTPASAEMDLATTYTSSEIARPIVMGDVLYFPGVGATFATIYEYFFEESTLSNTAANITKHVSDYIKNDVLMMAGDPTTGTLFVLTTNDQNRLYVYKTFFDGTEKLQSSWSRYEFAATESGAFIIGMDAMSGFLVFLIQREDGSIYLEQMSLERESQDATMGFTPFLDQREIVTATYDSATDSSLFDLAWDHNDDAQIILGNGHTTNSGIQPGVFYPSKKLLTLATVLAGETFIMNALTFTAHATTDTAASREYSISGNDIADAGKLTTLLNDTTYGLLTATATDNGDATITLTMDNSAQAAGLSAATGTTITNSTIVVADVPNSVGAKGDWSAASSYVGRTYTMTAKLSQLFIKELVGSTGPTVLTGRLQLKDITFRVVDTGFLRVTVAPADRTAYSYDFEGKIIGDNAAVGSPTMTSAFFKVPIWADSKNVDITLTNSQPQPCIIAAAAWRGFFNELSRQD
jgi:hypothetical protein